MCGIAGLCNWKSNVEANIKRMNDRMIHRGPDADGVYLSEDKCIALGHRRLSIVDLSPAGAQPMTSHSKRFVMAFNGEIYNHRKLREELIENGAVKEFRGTSDTEVLLELFEYYGVREGIAKCKGMFAISLYDKQEKTLYLLRDRVGEKPLYYGKVRDSFVFASEVGCLEVLEGFNNPIEEKVLPIYFIHGYIPAPYSIYQGIYKLEPGTMLTIKAPFLEWKIETYWSMSETARIGQQKPFAGTEEEATEELERLLKEAIKGQMVADVPVGAFLSSGIDSSTIVALMQSLSTEKVKTFTIGMEDPKYNEADVAKQIADHLGTEHTELYITERDAKEVIPKLAHMFGEPFADSSQIPTYLVSKLTKEHVTVSLSGDAGDELFCGYVSYDSIDRIWNKMKSVPYPVRKMVSSLVLNLPVNLGKIASTKAMLLSAKHAEHLYELSNEEEPLAKKVSRQQDMLPFKYTQYSHEFLKDTRHRIMLMDLMMYHPDDILVKVDRAGMAVSLESRIPMLDKDVVEFAWKLPLEYKYKNGVTKNVLRNILYKYVPKEIMDLPKRGFAIPVSKWLKEPELRAYVEELIDRKTLVSQGLLDPDVVWNIWNDYVERGIWRIQIWYILIFQQWMSERK